MPRFQVLLVEDYAADADLVVRALADAGIETRVVPSAAEALAALHEQSFAAVLLDYSLPDGDPWRVVVAASERMPRVPVVVVTGKDDPRAPIEAIRYGVAGYIKKDLSFWTELPSVVERVAAAAETAERARRFDELFAAMTERAADIIVRIDGRGIIQQVSPSCRAILGYAPEELVGRLSQEIVHADDRPGTVVARAPAQREATMGSLARIRRKDGTFAWIESRTTVVRDPATNAVLELVGIGRDVTDRVRAEEALREERARLAEAQRIAHLGSWEWDIATNAVSWSDELFRIHGLAPGPRASYEGVLEHVHPDDRTRVQLLVQRSLVEGKPVSVEYRIVRSDGEVRVIDGRGHVLFDDARRPLRMIGTAQDITEQKAVQEQLQRQTEMLQAMSLLDELTGAYNRRGFFTVAKPMLSLAQRNGVPCALLFADLDGLKLINDQHGHAAGDEMIRDAATVLRNVVRDSDIVARLGGDELALLAHNCHHAGADALRARLDAHVEQHNASSGRPYQLSFSIGTALFDPKTPEPIDVLLARADEAMYEEKRSRPSRPSIG